MATESPIRIVETADRWSTLKQSTRYGPSSGKMAVEGLGLFPNDQRSQSHENNVLPSRCESAPPSMEGSLAAIGNIFSHRKSTLNPVSKYPSIYASNSHTELQFHDRPSSSSSYHGTDVTLHQRLSETTNSLESSHVYQRTGTTSSGKTINAKCANSLQLPWNSLLTHEEGSEDDQSSGHSASVAVDKAAFLGYQSCSLDSVEEDSYHASTPSHGQFQSSNNKSMEKTVVSDAKSQFLHNVSASISTADAKTPCSDDMGQFLSFDGQSGLFVYPPVRERDFNAVKVDTQDNPSTAGGDDVDGAHFEAIKSVNLLNAPNLDSQKLHKKDLFIPQNEVLQHQAASQECNTSQFQGASSQIIYAGTSHAYGSLNQFHHNSSNVSTTEVQPILQSSGFTPPLYASQAVLMTSPSSFYPNMQPAGFFPPRYGLSGYNLNPAVLTACLAGYPREGTAPLAFDGAPFTPSGAPNGGILHAYDPQNQLKYYGQIGVPAQPPFYMQYFQQPVRDPYGTYSHFAHQTPRGGAVVNQVNSRFSKKGAELVGSSHDHKAQHLQAQHLHGTGYNNLNMETVNVSSPYFGSLTNASPMLQFPAPSAVSHVVRAKPAIGTNFSGGTYNMSFSPSSTGNSSKTNRQSQGWTNMNSYSLLEELKSSKGQRFEISDIAGHIVEFSVDQHGSRFIQQKLETCSVEEKISVFKEVVPHASKLITDVFGNYVIQKLFEYGSLEQRKYLADQLEGQILQLSLQMYGCRVIQKALDVIDLEQKASLVRELDGHVLRCVRDQNGNHVIQKCIESIPTDNIHFIISSFHGQVATLSMHPYGCRVIQRVLEHCNDEMRTQFIVDEILDSVCMLAQDQYGNYVTQHVLARGKPRERSEIIKKLAGSILQLSLNKFASNVVEKCLEHSDSTTRGMLIKEIIGHGDKNDNLLIMMKDQYANYVVQKILEICSSDQREILLGLIRNHITALKKYTYGKHIVARFEQLYGDELQTSGS